MLAFTMQFSKHEQNQPTTTTKPPTTPKQPQGQTVRYGGQTGLPARTLPTDQAGKNSKRPEEQTPRTGARFLRTQQCAHNPEPDQTRRSHSQNLGGTNPTGPAGVMNSQCSTYEQTHPQGVRLQHESWTSTPRRDRLSVWPVMLLRKEVIQPHLPVRLPCYDFVPIAGPTFDGSSHKG
jgi:hypothetical protein